MAPKKNTDDLIPTPSSNSATVGAPLDSPFTELILSSPQQSWLDRIASRYAKTFAALVIGGLTWGTVVVHSPAAHISADEWLQAGGALAVALGVYGATNTQ